MRHIVSIWILLITQSKAIAINQNQKEEFFEFCRCLSTPPTPEPPAFWINCLTNGKYLKCNGICWILLCSCLSRGCERETIGLIHSCSHWHWMSNPSNAHWCVIQHWYPLASMDKWPSEHMFWCRSGLIISERSVWGRKRSSKNLLLLFSLSAD